MIPISIKEPLFHFYRYRRLENPESAEVGKKVYGVFRIKKVQKQGKAARIVHQYEAQSVLSVPDGENFVLSNATVLKKEFYGISWYLLRTI